MTTSNEYDTVSVLADTGKLLSIINEFLKKQHNFSIKTSKLRLRYFVEEGNGVSLKARLFGFIPTGISASGSRGSIQEVEYTIRPSRRPSQLSGFDEQSIKKFMGDVLASTKQFNSASGWDAEPAFKFSIMLSHRSGLEFAISEGILRSNLHELEITLIKL